MLITGILINILAIGFLKKDRPSAICYNRISILILLYSCILTFNSYFVTISDSGISLYNGLWQVNVVSIGFCIFIYLASASVLTLGEGNTKGIQRGSLRIEDPTFFISEYPLILLFTVLGMICLVASGDLLSFFLGIELQSLSCAPSELTVELHQSTSDAHLSLAGTYNSYGCHGLSLYFWLTTDSNRIADNKGLQSEMAAHSRDVVQWFRQGYAEKLDTSKRTELGLHVLSRIVRHVNGNVIGSKKAP
jgi:hypothetical protein